MGDSADDEGEETEVEDVKGLRRRDVGQRSGKDNVDLSASDEIPDTTTGSGVLVGSSVVEQASAGAETRQRRAEEVDRSGEVSTDSEWEKVSQDGDR